MGYYSFIMEIFAFVNKFKYSHYHIDYHEGSQKERAKLRFKNKNLRQEQSTSNRLVTTRIHLNAPESKANTQLAVNFLWVHLI